jgi:hypothetical protein
MGRYVVHNGTPHQVCWPLCLNCPVYAKCRFRAYPEYASSGLNALDSSIALNPQASEMFLESTGFSLYASYIINVSYNMDLKVLDASVSFFATRLGGFAFEIMNGAGGEKKVRDFMSKIDTLGPGFLHGLVSIAKICVIEEEVKEEGSTLLNNILDALSVILQLLLQVETRSATAPEALDDLDTRLKIEQKIRVENLLSCEGALVLLMDLALGKIPSGSQNKALDILNSVVSVFQDSHDDKPSSITSVLSVLTPQKFLSLFSDASDFDNQTSLIQIFETVFCINHQQFQATSIELQIYNNLVGHLQREGEYKFAVKALQRFVDLGVDIWDEEVEFLTGILGGLE